MCLSCAICTINAFSSCLVLTSLTFLGRCPSLMNFLIVWFLVVSYHFVLGLPVLRKYDLTLPPVSSTEILLSGSCSSSLLVCASKAVCFSMSLFESLFKQFLSCSFLSLSFAISSSFLLDTLDQQGCLILIFSQTSH